MVSGSSHRGLVDKAGTGAYVTKEQTTDRHNVIYGPPKWRKSVSMTVLGYRFLVSAALTYDMADVNTNLPRGYSLGLGIFATRFVWEKHNIRESEYLMQLGPLRVDMKINLVV